jgi:hypothetical protein
LLGLQQRPAEAERGDGDLGMEQCRLARRGDRARSVAGGVERVGVGQPSQQSAAPFCDPLAQGLYCFRRIWIMRPACIFHC